MKTTMCRKLSLLLFVLPIAGMLHAQKPIKRITAPITVNTTWDCDTTYFLKSYIYVKNNATLTIQPGTVIIGDTTNKGSLIIERGSKLQAIGTVTCPIVFTSSRKPGLRKRGDWGGLILLGRGPLNVPGGEANIEGIPPSDDTKYGGGANPDPNDNSGTLKYVRVEFAGVALSPNNEINGLTMGAVGAGTSIDYVQVSFANDDSFEWFGGTVNAKHLIAFRGIDDDFDTDNGYSGKVQFAMGLRDKKVADVSGSKGFESDNDATGTANTPQTRAIFCNVTSDAGADTTQNSLFTAGAHIRRNSHQYIYNSIIMGFPEGLLIDGTPTQSNVLADTLVTGNIITCKYAPKYVVSTPVNSAVDNLLLSANNYYPGNLQVKLSVPYNLTAPNLRPKAGSPALNTANFGHAGLSDPFFTPVTYRGAFSQTTDWTTGWANFDPVNAVYTNACACSTGKAVEVAENTPVLTDLVIYPNPAHGAFKINLTGFSNNVVIKVTNMMTGNIVYSAQRSNPVKNANIDVNLPNATAGLYTVEVSDGSKSVTKKVNIF